MTAMASWWPTPAAAKAMPEIARQMDALPKVVDRGPCPRHLGRTRR